jgi:hypothetical protein
VEQEKKFDVFLAHNSQDKPTVRAIAQKLKQQELKPWLDEEQIVGGDTILEKVYSGITQSRTGAFFISRNGLGNFQENIELYTVINWFLKQQGKSKSFRVIPILLPGVINVPDKIAHLEIWKYIQFNSSNDESALQDLIRSIKPSETTPEDRPSPDRRKFLKWAGWGTLGLVTPVAVIQLTNELKSERGIDYTKLRDLLKANNWQEAEQETDKVMLKALDEKINREALLKFPCTDLRTIDHLWVKYSNGNFGFSVQRQIYWAVGGNLQTEEAWNKFVQRVGWTGSVTFHTFSPKGHLPRSGWIYGFDDAFGIGSSLLSRLVNCNI